MSETVLKRAYIPVLLTLAVIAVAVFGAFGASNTKSIISFAQGMVDDIYDLSAQEKVSDILTTDLADTYPALWSLLQSVVDSAITPVAYAVLGIYFVLTMINVGMNPQQATAYQFIRPLIWFIAAALFIWMTPQIIINGIAFGGELAGEITDAAQEAIVDTSGAETIKQYIENHTTELGAGITFVLQLAFPWLLKQVLALAMQLLAWAAMLEVFVRAMFMPLSFGPMIMHGFNETGTRYLRVFIACCIKIALMVAISIMGMFLMSTQLVSVDGGEYLTACATITVVEFAIVFLMMGCDRIARDIMAV